MSTITFSFDAIDTWFFRESRPYGTIGGSELISVFPPPARTLAGVVRSLIGECLGVNWKEYGTNEEYRINGNEKKLKDIIGYRDNLGPLKFRGVYLCDNGKRLYPTPALLIKKEDFVSNLLPGKPVICDLGKVQLPTIISEGKVWKPVENTWVTQDTLKIILSNQRLVHLQALNVG